MNIIESDLKVKPARGFIELELSKAAELTEEQMAEAIKKNSLPGKKDQEEKSNETDTGKDRKRSP